VVVVVVVVDVDVGDVVDDAVLGDVVDNVVVLGGVVFESAVSVVLDVGSDVDAVDGVALPTVRLVQPDVTRTSPATKVLVRPDMTSPDGIVRRPPPGRRRALSPLVGPRQDG
jgi:hypothetical protein